MGFARPYAADGLCVTFSTYRNTIRLAADTLYLRPNNHTVNSWNLYSCSVNATILIDTAKAMVATGLRDAGCWSSAARARGLRPRILTHHARDAPV